MPVEFTADVAERLDALVDRLAEEYCDRVPRRRVEETVRHVRAEFGTPTITDYLPILVEREVRHVLSN